MTQKEITELDKNKYVVLNLSDEIDVYWLIGRLQAIYKANEQGSSAKYSRYRILKVKDIAEEIENALRKKL